MLNEKEEKRQKEREEKEKRKQERLEKKKQKDNLSKKKADQKANQASAKCQRASTVHTSQKLNVCCVIHAIFFVCTRKLFVFYVCTHLPYADTCITLHVFVRNRNKLVLEMLMSSYFTCDEGELQTDELQTGEFQPQFQLPS